MNQPPIASKVEARPRPDDGGLDLQRGPPPPIPPIIAAVDPPADWRAPDWREDWRAFWQAISGTDWRTMARRVVLWGHLAVAAMYGAHAFGESADASRAHHYDSLEALHARLELSGRISKLAGEQAKTAGSNYFEALAMMQDAAKSSPLARDVEVLQTKARASQVIAHEASVRFYLAAIWTAIAVGIIQLRKRP